MIDIHCHILPGIDDGAQSMEESVGMAQAAVMEGITHLIATPHHANGKYMNEPSAVTNATASLNAKLHELQIPLTILPGQEIRIGPGFLDRFYDEELMTLHTSPYMLVEFPPAKIPERIEDTVHELLVHGITPVIAHPERNQEIVSQPGKLYELIESGCLSQVTTHSLLGGFGRKIRNVSLDLCKRNLVHFVASDAHNLTHRSFLLRSAYELLDRELGNDYSALYEGNAACLFNGLTISKPKPVSLPKKWYKLWL